MILNVKLINVIVVLIFIFNVSCYPKGGAGKDKTDNVRTIKNSPTVSDGSNKLLGNRRKDDQPERSGDKKQQLGSSVEEKQLLARSGEENQQLAGSDNDNQDLDSSGDNNQELAESESDNAQPALSETEQQELGSSDKDNNKLSGSDGDNNDLIVSDNSDSGDKGGEPTGYETDRSKTINATIKINEDHITGSIEIPTDFETEIVDDKEDVPKPITTRNCWMGLETKQHFEALDELDAKYSAVREAYQAKVGERLEKQLLSGLVFNNGAAKRALHQAGGVYSRIPAGLNLGGYCMMRMPSSVMFFHRMKLRNNTNFRVNFLQSDLVNMALVTRLSLNDLHLMGAYERSNTDSDPSILFYIPSFGEVQILLKNVTYKMEGRLRLLNNRLLVELINSEIITKDILMTYVKPNNTLTEATKIQTHNINEFLSRMKCDLDTWLKDYFNDYLMHYVNLKPSPNKEKFLQYEKEKTVKSNEYADLVLDGIKQRLKEYGATSVKIPHFTIYSVMNMKISLHNGVLRGLDSIYRRSVATTRKIGKIRKIDAIVAFSKLKVEYQYDAVVGTGLPPLSGNLILSADELTAHMELSQIINPDTVDINFDDFVQTSPESLTVEGPANRVISNFKQLLEHSIVAIMSNTLIHNVYMMKSLTRCEPYIHGNDQKKQKSKKPKFVDDMYTSTSDHLEPNENKSETPEAIQSDNSDPEGSGDLQPENIKNVIATDSSSNDSDEASDVAHPEINAEAAPNTGKDFDYFMTKNESLELEVPMNGKMEKLKLKNYNEFVIKKP